MKKLLLTMVFSTGAIFFSAEPSEACEECSSGSCLAGCSVLVPDCDQWATCIEMGDGSCQVGGKCDSASTGTDLTGTYATETPPSEYDSHFARLEESNGIVYRRTCNGAVIDRSYRPEVISQMEHQLLTMTL